MDELVSNVSYQVSGHVVIPVVKGWAVCRVPLRGPFMMQMAEVGKLAEGQAGVVCGRNIQLHAFSFIDCICMRGTSS